ncbi:MAG: septum formation protein Maf [Candidatus Melainabacteria bacterium]|nr:septum formation protein Maf [Candidatus Melainabacteria bacterium]
MKKRLSGNKKILNTLKKRSIILASKSQRRIKILKSIGLNFTVRESNVNEKKLIKNYKNKSASKIIQMLSLAKARSVFKKLKSTLQGDELILGFDTIVVCKNKIIDKPTSKEDALKKLLFLSNKKHKVYTGIGIIDLNKNQEITSYETTTVYMKLISKPDAIKYIKTKEPFGKAGSYAIQGKGKKFIKKIEGDYLNVVGLPLSKLLLTITISLY